MKHPSFLAVDLGATSGRTILGTLKNGRIQLKELTRFPNQNLQVGNHFYWDIDKLFDFIVQGLKVAATEGVEICSIGIDTWGVDFLIFDENGNPTGNPLAYRDPHTLNAPEEFFRKISKEKVYELTGIQVLNFNSLYQLYALNRDNNEQLSSAKEILFMPDALAYLLTGQKVVEYTIASTSQILNPRTKQFEPILLEAAGVPAPILGEIVMPGHKIGVLKDKIAESSGLGKIPVVAVAGHDTASAVAAIPAESPNFAYLSSGTWSLMGIEVDQPIINADTYAQNFTNEGGVEGTIRLLKNITGMWLLEQCLKEWNAVGNHYPYDEIVQMASQSESFRSLIDPDDEDFAQPTQMTVAIQQFCIRTGQPAPQSPPEFIRCIFESLALKYNFVLGKLMQLAPFAIERLHIIGGGSKNALLNQWTANATGLEVIAGPSEATAIGNIMIQAKSAGHFDSLQEMRKVIKDSISADVFLPEDTIIWAREYSRFLAILK